jgi:hypothetical protein
MRRNIERQSEHRAVDRERHGERAGRPLLRLLEQESNVERSVCFKVRHELVVRDLFCALDPRRARCKRTPYLSDAGAASFALSAV